MPVYVPDQKDIDNFLPKREPIWNLDIDNPITFGNLILPHEYEKVRKEMQESQDNAKKLICDIAREWEKKFGGFNGDLLEYYNCDGADYILISMGAIGAESKVAINNLQKNGYKIGLARLRAFRPFPKEEIQLVLKAHYLMRLRPLYMANLTQKSMVTLQV
jgi:pyruvate/2-oxoacid:ferredoxin oxidoreductase alpha subunit